MQAFRRRPIKVEAVQVTNQNIHDISEWMGGNGKCCYVGKEAKGFFILRNGEVIDIGEWVIKNEDGSFEVQNNFQFVTMYEPVEDATVSELTTFNANREQ
jgi:hypothetical protein